MIAPEIGEVLRANIRPGDRLVVRLRKTLPVEIADKIRSDVSTWAGGAEVICLPPFVELEILSLDEVAP